MNEKFFQLKPRLKKDIKEKVFEAKAIFEVEAEGRDREMKAEAKKCFRDVLFKPRFNWKHFLFTRVIFYNTFL